MQPCSSPRLDLTVTGNHHKEKQELRMAVVSSPTHPSTRPSSRAFSKKTNCSRLVWITASWLAKSLEQSGFLCEGEEALQNEGPSWDPTWSSAASHPAQTSAAARTNPAQRHTPYFQPSDLGDNAISHTVNHKYFTFTVEATHLIKHSLDN